MTMTDREFLDNYAGGGDRHPAFKFENVGDTVRGVIVERPRVVDVDNNGKAEKRMVIAVAQEGGEIVSIWIKPGYSATAVKEALEVAGADGLVEGGTFAMKLDELRQTGKPSPAKVFKASYKPPAPSGVTVDDLLDM